MSLPTKILAAAMRSRHHIHVDYAPHTNGLSVQGLPADTVYDGSAPERVLFETQTVYLDWEGADEKLADVLAMIEELES